MSGRGQRLKVLLLSSPEAESAVRLQEVLAEHVELVTATSLAECLRLLARAGGPASGGGGGSRMPSSVSKTERAAGFDSFLCDWCYQGGTWRNALELIRRRAPELPVIVVCRTGGEAEWMEVLQAGAFDMLTAPFTANEVLFALMNAAAEREERDATAVRECA